MYEHLVHDPSFRDEFSRRAKDRHNERLGFCHVSVQWPVALQTVDREDGRKSKSQILEVSVEWHVQALEKCLPQSNVKGHCSCCLEEDAEMVALTPCGHMIGKCCSARFYQSACPLCRKHVSGVQSLFQPN